MDNDKPDSGADQFFRCTATVAECLADNRAGIDALTDAADSAEPWRAAFDVWALEKYGATRYWSHRDDAKIFAAGWNAAHQERAA